MTTNPSANLSPEAHAATLMKKLLTLSESRASDMHNMCMILQSFNRVRLWEDLGYKSFKDFTGDLPFSYSKARRMINFYVQYRELGYTKKEAIQILESVSVSPAARQLKQDTKKTTVSSFIKRVRAKKSVEGDKLQICFTFEKEEDLELVESWLREYGMKEKDSYRTNLTDALVAIFKEL